MTFFQICPGSVVLNTQLLEFSSVVCEFSKGEKGDMGQEGSNGDKGETGLKGKEGPPGNPGLTGVRVSVFHS